MTRHTISASESIAAPAEQLYRIIADYRDGHLQILPRPPFGELAVERGGVGEGTVIRFEMRLAGRTRRFHAAISEPEPGRVLVETDLETGTTTAFTVDPSPDGRQSMVTIATTTTVRGGLVGRLEAWMTTRLLGPIYRRELAQLAVVAAQRAGVRGGGAAAE